MDSTSTDSRIEAYQTSIARLTKAIADLRREQRRMKWVAVATVVLSVAAYFAISHMTGLFVLLVGIGTFGVGHYVVYMHIYENRLTIKSAKESIASLRK